MMKLMSCFFLLLSISSIACTQNNIPQDVISNKNITITSHRGYGGLYPENTLLGIQKAIELGVHRIEIDVHQTKDGIVVLMHDEDINRTTNETGKVKDLTFEALKQYHVSSDGKSEPIPSLEEAIQLVNGKSILLIEVKKGNSDYPNIEANIVELIKKHKATKWCMIQSFEDDVLIKFNSLAPQLELHKLLLLPYFYSFEKLEFVSEFSIYYKLVSKRLVRKIHEQQKKINVWTVNDNDQMINMIDKGVDGIITDYPALLLETNN